MTGALPLDTTPATLDLDFSGIAIRVEAPATYVERLARDWSAFVVEHGDAHDAIEHDLTLSLRSDPSPYDAPDYRPKAMSIEPRADGAGARFSMAEGEAHLSDDGSLHGSLVAASASRAYFTLINFLRAGLARRLPARRGALLLHAAGLVFDGRGFILVGPQDSGKSTWTRLGASVGGHAVSDDLLIVERVPAGFELVGSPFRSTSRDSEPRRGRWPLVALLTPEHGPAARLDALPPLLRDAQLAANVPFVEDRIGTGGAVDDMLDALRQLPARRLTFALDAGYVKLLRGWEPPA